MNAISWPWHRTLPVVFDPAPLDRCAQCGRPLQPSDASLWFCTRSDTFGELWSPCQLLWYASQTLNPAAIDPKLDLAALAAER